MVFVVAPVKECSQNNYPQTTVLPCHGEPMAAAATTSHEQVGPPHVFACMYLLIGLGQSSQKDHTGAKMYESSSFLNARCSGTDATASGKRFQCLTALHVKLFP